MYNFFKSSVYDIASTVKNKFDYSTHENNKAWVLQNWSEPKRTATLNKIVLVDKQTFDSLFEGYSKIRRSNIKATPTDDLRVQINDISNSNVMKGSKDQLIADAIRRYMENHQECRFCRYLIKNSDRLVNISAVLMEETNLNESKGELRIK